MLVTVDKNSGFCWGVVRAVDFAEAELKENPKLYSLGEIIHNPVEVERLGEIGLETISHSDFERIAKENRESGRHDKVLIRAHGEPPATYRLLEKLGLEVVDATCPVVSKVQERIQKFYEKGYQVVIYGKLNHPEVLGLRGVVNDEAIVILSVEEALEKVDFARPTVLFTQTTVDRPTFHAIRDALKLKIQELVVAQAEDDAKEFLAKDTICGQVSGREKKLIEFAKSQDVMIFVAGRNSSNGKVLYHVAHDANPRTYFIETEAELLPEWLEGAERVGITGATSTPQWLMSRVADWVYRMAGEPEKAELLPVVG